ncbi:flagellar filament capping protein FliD [Candidatus Paracaedibacter symbiosus]|uniref:flagellar filament capping protein FliD n=1 Tax=Candidatus Paracaedibacter symbiosus TaxID=244582 RepID=UPI000509C7C9|nr:flagellar filament capping protein FliD [Candidatus Paracaedibacter symbiosus]
MVEVAGISFGKITVDKETGRTKIGQTVEGMDVGKYFEDIKAAKMYKVEKQRDIIEKNTKKIAALEEFKKKALQLNTTVSKMSNRLIGNVSAYGDGKQVPNLMQQFKTTINGAANSPLVDISSYESASVGSFNMVINQIASTDFYQGQVSVIDPNGTAMGLSGTFTIGTILPNSAVQFTITPDMTLSQINSTINAQSTTTGVIANFAQLSPSTPTTPGLYNFSLTATAMSNPIILQDNSGGILTSWDLMPYSHVSVQSGPESITTDPTTALGLTGNLVIGAGTAGATDTINTTGLSLQNIIDAVNAQTGTTNVTAALVPIYPVNAMSATLPTGYGLSLSTTNNQPLILAKSDATAIAGLQLKSTINSSINAIVNTADPTQDQAVTGNLILQAGSGAPIPPIITAGKSLNDIVQAINATTSTSGIFANLQTITPANPSVAGSLNICQLTIATNNGTSLITSASDATVITGLGLNTPVNDYQGMISKVSINGINYQRPNNTIDNIVDGVVLKLRAAQPDVPNVVEVTQDMKAAEEALGEIIGTYNELNSFFNMQTAMERDPNGLPINPKEGAYLHDDPYVRQFMTNLQQVFSTTISGPTNGTLTSLGSIGFEIDFNGSSADNSEPGALVLTKEKLYRTAVDDNYSKLVALFENTITNTDPNFSYTSVPGIIDPNLMGKDIKISLTNDPVSGNLIATVSANGPTYPATVALQNGIPCISIQNTGTCLDKFVFQYSATPPLSGNTVSTILNITPGIMAQVDGFLLSATDPNSPIVPPGKKLLPPFDKNGPLLQDIEVVKMKNKKLAEDTERMKKSIEKEMESVERRFDKVYEAKARYQSIKLMLNSFLKANSR